ncbi:CDP-diacylglycerol--serine O-phosphatidyltransferase [Bacteriovorax sp. PP10]|uniref:CDP-diacylglycerol--serine O-phosphatidyltransferase n=1 Tax=Bacteriovorax antarcticus TaxID=3088717 RepID=A0ABU5VU18_9BACT|nr:CDP-diacylglycerol--serine O-phosphatidyltransferase [Bacteriovorax sp. PP10]MEA9356544.1 CDP-diacylglycerol--serine O-phosphatidyltransferase [Bacteriovorax sp. PP10]
MLNTPRRLAFFLPNTFTALNMACGFFSVILGWRGEFTQASLLLILGAVFDSVDGRVARMTGTQSAFGEQFDSISDVVTFGVAPAFLVYNKFFFNMGRLGLITSFIFLLCGALRLARFNANIDKVSSDFFQGLPIPSGALAIVGLILFTGEYPEAGIMDHPWIAVVYVLFYAFLMISNIPFNSFKNSPWVKSHKKRVLFLIFIIMILIVLAYEIMIGGLILLYVLGSLLYFFKNKGALEEMFHWKGEEDDDQGHQI